MSRKLTGIILCAVFAALLLCSCSGTEENQEGINGTWYASQYGEMWIYRFKEDGTCARYAEEVPDMEEYSPFSFDEESGSMKFSDAEDETYRAELTEEAFIIENVTYEETYHLYRDRKKALESDPFYLQSDEFTDTIRDQDGWCIRDGILYAYRGDAVSVTVPGGVKEIYNSAFSGDSGHGTELTEVTVPGSVEKIDDGAFSFTNADTIRIEEGVRVMGSGAFSDAYLEEIWFPESLTEIGSGIMETEEGLRGTRIHVKKDSEICRYLKKHQPYGSIRLIEE